LRAWQEKKKRKGNIKIVSEVGNVLNDKGKKRGDFKKKKKNPLPENEKKGGITREEALRKLNSWKSRGKHGRRGDNHAGVWKKEKVAAP